MKVLLLIALLMVSPVAGLTLLEDPAGDVRLASYGNEVPMPGPWEAVDLRAVAFEETPAEFWVTVQVDGYDGGPGDLQATNGDVRTVMQYGEKRYVLQSGRDLDGVFYSLWNEVVASDFDFRRVANLEHVADAEAGTIKARLPRALLLDEHGSPPTRGRQIVDIHSMSFSQFSLGAPPPDDPFNCCVDALVTADNMPDDGPGAAYTIRFGGSGGSGGLAVRTDQPYRASNGGQTSLRFEVEIANGGEDMLRPVARVEGLPEGWTVQMPEESLVLRSLQRASLPLLVSTPARHQHGGSSNFTLHLEAAGASAWLELGVHYLDVPQPAGHHDTLHLHVRRLPGGLDPAFDAMGYADGDGFMSTLADDPADTGRSVDSTANEFMGTSSRWDACLSPALALGLDFDLNRTGELTAVWSAGRTYGQTNFSGKLVLFGAGAPGESLFTCDADDYRAAGRMETVLAELTAPPQSLGRGEDAAFTATLVPLPASDRVAFQPGSTLMLLLQLDYEIPDTLGPGPAQLQPGGWFRLPLNEYLESVPGLPAPAVAEAEQPDAAPLDDEPKRSTPGVPTVLLVGLVAIAAWIRRP